MKKSRRTERVSSLIKKILGEIITTEITDSKMGLVTITDVDVTKDLKIARVYFTLIGGEKDIQKQKNIITRMNKFLRYEISQKIILRYIPEIQMIYDETSQKAQKIELIFKEIQREKK